MKFNSVCQSGVGTAQSVGFESRQCKIFIISTVSRRALRPGQPPIQRVPGTLSPGDKAAVGVKLTTHLHLVIRGQELYRKFSACHSLTSFMLLSTSSYASLPVVAVQKSLWLFLFAAQPKEFFLDGLKKLEQRSYKCVELRGSM
jgi:hypothetical protein